MIKKYRIILDFFDNLKVEIVLSSPYFCFSIKKGIFLIILEQLFLQYFSVSMLSLMNRCDKIKN